MRALKPWKQPVSTFRDEMDRMFDRLFGPWSSMCEFSPTGEWAPDLDVSETKDAMVVRADVPGTESKDIQVSLQEQLLTIKGERGDDEREKDERHHRVERHYGAFMRAVRMPAPVDAAKVSATFKNGVLTITLPKTQVAKSTPIPIKAD